MMKKVLANILLTAVILGGLVASIPLFATSLESMSAMIITVGDGRVDRKEFKRCSKPRSLRMYATIQNCIEFERLNYQDVSRDVQAKSLMCGGKPSFWHQIQRSRYMKCMGS